jgi:hypothetical protein
MSNKQFFKNGGFPPIKYCPMLENKKDTTKTQKERLFANAPKQNINIRQLLTESNNKKPLIIADNIVDNDLEVVDEL